jgi:TATA-box binding protein (TBP) (component of TFIID and TFIIIB)
MSQSVKEFVRQSGVDVRSPDSNSNNNFARELEEDMFRRQDRMARREEIARGQQFFREPTRPELQQRRVPPPPPRRSRFAQFENNSPLENEFSDVNMNKLVNNALREPINTSEFDNMNLTPINEAAFERGLAEMNPNTINEFGGLTDLEISPLKPGLFVGTINKSFGKEVRLDLLPILMKKPLGKTPIGQGLYIDTKEIKGIYGQFKTGFSHTKEGGPKGSINKPFASVQIMVTVSDGVNSQGGLCNIYRNGKILFRNGFVGTNITNQPELIRRFIVDNYTQKEPFLYSPIEYNNLSGQFSINGVFTNLTRMQMKFSKYGSATYEPELSPMLYVTMKGYTLNISKSGTVQIIGAKSPAIMENAYKAVTPLIREFYRDGDVKIDNTKRKTKAKRKTKTKVSPPKKTKPIVKRKAPLTNNQINALKIDGKKCDRMSRDELKTLARKVGILSFRIKNGPTTRDMRKDEICAAIKAKSKTKNVTVKNINKNKNVKLSGTGSTFRIGGKLCRDKTLTEIKQFAALLKINTSGKQTKDALCKQIEKSRNNLAKPKPPPPPKPTKRNVQKEKKAQVQTEKMKERVKRVGLDDNSIRKDLEKQYGKAWMNRYKPNLTQDVRNIKNAASRVNSNDKNKALGVPKKMVVNRIKKDMVSRWKMQRKRNLERNYVMKNVNVTGVPNNMKNKWRQAAANEALRRNKILTAKQFAGLKKKWLKGMKNIIGNGNARRNIGAARARVETL